jgi:thiol-disulfide isomerase/thioredoxin
MNIKMRHVYLISVLFVIIFPRCNNDEVRIEGQIIGNISERISYSIPVNGVSYSGFTETIIPDSSGYFQISFSLKESAFVCFNVSAVGQKIIIIRPGKDYKIIIDPNNKTESIIISGTDEEGQALYNTLPNPFLVQQEAKKYFREPSLDTIKQKLYTLKEKDISMFKRLLENRKISKNFFKLFMIDRDCYYATMEANIMFIKYVISSSGADSDDLHKYTSEMKSNWENIYTKYPPDQADLMRTRWWFEYATTFLNCKEYLSEDYNSKNSLELQNKGLYHTHKIDIAKKYFNGPVLEYYIPAYIHFVSLDLAFEEEFISIFNNYQSDFPENNYSKYVESWISSVKEFHKIASSNLSEGIKFIHNYESIVSLKEAINSFKGKKIYVDVWATWCEPCKYEFRKEDGLIRTLNTYDTEILFISIDNENREELWKDMIKYYDLKGYHLRATKQLSADLRDIFSQTHKGAFYIPFHIYIDEKGKILKTE